MSLESSRTPVPASRSGARRPPTDRQHVRARRRRLVTWLLFSAALVLMVNALVGDNGYLATLRAEREHAALQAELSRLRLENRRLADESRRLREDPTALEEAARELGMLKPGETLVIIKDRAPAGSTGAPR
jgi:cell division protein FtsB